MVSVDHLKGPENVNGLTPSGYDCVVEYESQDGTTSKFLRVHTDVDGDFVEDKGNGLIKDFLNDSGEPLKGYKVLEDIGGDQGSTFSKTVLNSSSADYGYNNGGVAGFHPDTKEYVVRNYEGSKLAERFKEQVKAKDTGDKEAMSFDRDYVTALEHGMPPAVGVGAFACTLSPIVGGAALIGSSSPRTNSFL